MKSATARLLTVVSGGVKIVEIGRFENRAPDIEDAGWAG
jgi:hypothetical protein